MPDSNELLKSLLKDTSEFAVDELQQLVKEVKSDSSVFIRHIGECTEEFIRMRAQGEIKNDEFKELMEDLLDLDKLQFHKLNVEAKVRAEKITKKITNLVLTRLLPLLLKSASGMIIP